MPGWSRRRALQTVATTGALALAGCSGGSSATDETPPERGDPVPPADLDVLFVRETDGEPLFDLEGEVEDGDDDGTTPENARLRSRRTRSEYLRDAESRERVTFRSTTAAVALEEFVDGTDLESGSVYLLERPVSSCYEARLVGVYREAGRVDADLCQSFRPADFLCSLGGIDTVGVGVRLPFPGDGVADHGWNWRGECGTLRTVAAESGEDR